MDQSWFEMWDLRKRKLDKSVWIPLRAEKIIRNSVQFGFIDYIEEFIGYGSIMVPIDKQSFTEQLDWTDVGITILTVAHFMIVNMCLLMFITTMN